MLCDVRSMPKDEIIKVLRKINKFANKKNCDIIKSDNKIYLTVKYSSFFSGWRFECSYFSDSLFLEYYPPNGGLVRFDAVVRINEYSDVSVEDSKECFTIINSLIDKYSNAGKNTIEYFEKL